LGFLDSLKGFIVNVLLGFLTLRLLKYLPKLKEVFVTILKAGNFIIEISGKILDGLVTFVDYGYKGYDHARKIVGKIGGEKAIESMDKLSSQMNSVLNSIFIAGMLFSDFGTVGQGGGIAKKSIDASVDVIKDTLTQQAGQEVAKQAARAAIGPLGVAGIVLGTGLLASAIGEGAFQVKKLGKGLQGWLSGKLTQANQDKNPLTRFLKKGFYSWMQGTLAPALWILNGTGVLFDIVGAPFRYGVELIRAAFMKLNDDKKGLDEQRKNLGKFDARVRDGIREQFSILSPLFKFIGMKGVSQKLETPGSLGSLYGEQAAKDMGYYGGGKVIKVRKYAAGGPVSIKRTEVKEVDIERTDVSKISTLKIGSSVGGAINFAKVFPASIDDPERMDRYSYMEDAYYTIRGVPNLGNVMSLTVKTLVGDQVTKSDYDNAGQSLAGFMLRGLQSQNPAAYNSLTYVLDFKQFSGAISTFLMKSTKDQFSGIVNLLRTQVGLAPLPGETTGSEADPCAAACDTGTAGGGMAVAGDATDKAILDLISSVEAQSYDTMNVSRGATAGKPTQMTVDWLAANANGAIGRYQQMPEYVRERVIAAGGKGTDKFTPELQDRTALKMLYSGHGYARWRSGQMSDEEFGNRLSATWRGLPHSSGGTYPDQYSGRNKAHISRPAFMTRLAQIRAGAGGMTMAKILPGSPATNVDSCICDPETPSGDPGDIQAAGATAGGNISGYPVTSGYGMRTHPITGRQKMHGGIDIGVPSGKPIALNVAGVAGPPPQYEGGYGNFIDIQVPSLGNLYFRFAHMLKPPNYKPGQQIPAGKIFGYVGSTGASTGAHIHFEVNKSLSGYGGDRDPMSYGKYISIGRESGGPTFMGGMRLLHKGEYVIDKDSVDLFGGNSFYSMINGVENERQRAQKSSALIQHLSKYTGRKIDERPPVIFEDSENIIVPSPPIFLPVGSGSYGFSDDESGWEYDNLERGGM
jgi:murein DD-endopeptidase MepM/ murein hydrolase activator NlpD